MKEGPRRYGRYQSLLKLIKNAIAGFLAKI